jgi:FimV-like protein
MGDREGAREILREVIHDGDEAQQAEAKSMLAKLGG